MFKFPMEGLQRNRDNLLAHWDAITYKLGDFGTSAYLTHTVQTVNEEAGTIPFEAPEIEDLLRVRRDIQAKPCDIYSLGMTLAATMMYAVIFNDIGEAHLMDQLMVICSTGQPGVQPAAQMTQTEFYKKHRQLLPIDSAIRAIQNFCDEPDVAHLIFTMVRKQPQMRNTMQWVLQQIDTL